MKVYEHLTNGTALPAVVNPFTDTNYPEVLKAYNAGIREQCATMLTRTFKRCTMPGWSMDTDSQYKLDYAMPAPFADDAHAEELIERGHRLLDEALALDERCHDALRMKQAAESTSFESYYDFLAKSADDVRAACEEARAQAHDESPERDEHLWHVRQIFLDEAGDLDFRIEADVDLDASQEEGQAVFTNYRVGFVEELV